MSDFKKTMSKTGLAYFLILGISTLLQAVAVYVITAVFGYDYTQNSILTVAITGLPIYVTAIIIYFIIIRPLPRVDAKQRSTIKPLHLLALIVFCIGLTYITNIASQIVVALISLIKGTAVLNPLKDVTTSTDIIFNIVYLCILAPICEELIFRKMLWHAIGRYGERLFVITSAIIFGLFHGNLVQFLYAFILGFVLALVYVRTGRIIYSMILHISINVIGTTVFPQLLASPDKPILFYTGLALFLGTMIFAGIMLALYGKKIKLYNNGDELPEHAMFYEFSSVGMVLYFALAIAVIVIMTVV